jgi:hypothetical protein
MAIPKFDFNPAPDFTQNLKAGDKVFLWYGSTTYSKPDFEKVVITEVTRVTPNLVITTHPRYDGETLRFKKADRLEYGCIFDYPSEIYPYNAETLAVYTELKRRAEIVDLIECATSWNLLPTETLEAIAGLMEAKNV